MKNKKKLKKHKELKLVKFQEISQKHLVQIKGGDTGDGIVDIDDLAMILK